MVTYRRGLSRRGWYRSIPIRVLLIIVGVGLFFVGGVARSLEEEYGGDPDRQEYVIGWDDQLGGAVVLGEGGEVVYDATDVNDAEAWVESQRGSRNFTVPILFMASGVILFVAGVAPSPTRQEPESTAPVTEPSTRI